ncbi:MAG: MFS transporter [Lewinellaceae bacterium]|nr:MFS transporter [Lewinellaceae bacterium]
MSEKSNKEANSEAVVLGLKVNWRQFTLLVLVNAFVGGMVGLERTLLPELATTSFGIAAKTAIFSFIIVFGITKALTNYYTGALANRWGRKNLLLWGWLLALPIPFMLMWAPSWGWIVVANGFLGVHQGLTWSSTVVMKIDLVGARDRGLAMGLNEASGYLAVGAVAFLTGLVASHYGVRPYPFWIGVVLSVAGLLTTWLWVKDTRRHMQAEAAASSAGLMRGVFWETTWKNPNLGAITQAGLINNLNDGLMWGLLPILLTQRGLSLSEIGLVAAVYPGVWGLGQLFTGKMADHYPVKRLLTVGMLLQGIVLLGLLFSGLNIHHYIFLAASLGFGTALVYPTFLVGVAQYAHPRQRAESIGIFRLWRDLGYALGAILTGVIADVLSIGAAILAVALLTLASGVIVWVRMRLKPAE